MPRRYVRPLGYGESMNKPTFDLYKIHYKGRYKKVFWDRDQALNWIAQEVASGGGDFEDYEILDGSDFL